MTTETEKSPREIAEQIILHEYGVTWKADSELIAAIEKALHDRDERAAKIAECWLDRRVAKSWTSTQTANGIAGAIRGKA